MIKAGGSQSFRPSFCRYVGVLPVGRWPLAPTLRACEKNSRALMIFFLKVRQILGNAWRKNLQGV